MTHPLQWTAPPPFWRKARGLPVAPMSATPDIRFGTWHFKFDTAEQLQAEFSRLGIAESGFAMLRAQCTEESLNAACEKFVLRFQKMEEKILGKDMNIIFTGAASGEVEPVSLVASGGPHDGLSWSG